VTAARTDGARSGVVLAVDGGNSKTDLALLDSGGELLSLVRGGGSSSHHLGFDGAIAVLQGLFEQAVAQAGLDHSERPVVSTAHLMLAGADLPEELATLHERIAQRGWSERLALENDTVALLRAGTDRGWGIAVVCGAGMNCVGVAPDGRTARFLSLGDITGDWGGGYGVGLSALGAAARSADGRGPQTVLETAVPAHFGLTDPLDVSRAIHQHRLAMERLGELARIVLAASDHDAVASGIIDRLADEVVAYASAALRRLELTGADPDVVLGGSLIRAVSSAMLQTIAVRIQELAPDARVLITPSDPIVGAALRGLDELVPDGSSSSRARVELDAAVVRLTADLSATGPRAS
jgi:N-acetylglucosamine kinase-like BadF-type ATPase